MAGCGLLCVHELRQMGRRGKDNDKHRRGNKAKYAAVVVDRMTGDIVSKHKSYDAANKAATKRGNRYAVQSWRAYA